MNRLSIQQIDIDYTRPINNRAKLDTGKLCNYSCEFCYYKNHLSERDALDKIFKRIDYIQAYGITEIDLSGGESSIEPNWFKILEYCQGKFERISCLSHGGKFSNMEFLQKSYDLGLREILFSMHATNKETHDVIVRRRGAFDNLTHAMHNANLLDMEVRINTTICDLNYDTIDTTVYRRFNPSQVNFIALNYWQDNAHGHVIDYGVVCNWVKQYIDCLPNIEVNARYFPLCYMNGYESNVKNHYDHIYDFKDWNKAIYNEDVDTSVAYTHEQKVDQCIAEAERIRLQSYFKTKDCTSCKHFFTCDGIENELRGIVSPLPVTGEKNKVIK
jgi:hypothetical protein